MRSNRKVATSTAVATAAFLVSLAPTAMASTPGDSVPVTEPVGSYGPCVDFDPANPDCEQHEGTPCIDVRVPCNIERPSPIPSPPPPPAPEVRDLTCRALVTTETVGGSTQPLFTTVTPATCPPLGTAAAVSVHEKRLLVRDNPPPRLTTCGEATSTDHEIVALDFTAEVDAANRPVRVTSFSEGRCERPGATALGDRAYSCAGAMTPCRATP